MGCTIVNGIDKHGENPFGDYKFEWNRSDEENQEHNLRVAMN